MRFSLCLAKRNEVVNEGITELYVLLLRKPVDLHRSLNLSLYVLTRAEDSVKRVKRALFHSHMHAHKRVGGVNILNILLHFGLFEVIFIKIRGGHKTDIALKLEHQAYRLF